MTDHDFDRFLGEFRRLAAAFVSFKLSPEEAKAKAGAYFHVLKKYSIGDVIAKVDRWLETESKMPKPAEWANVILVKHVELAVLSHVDAEDWLRAERLRWEDAPCACQDCRAADVTEKPLRFVPDFDADDRDRKVRLGDRIVTAGHWAHGFELAQWYRARGDFWNGCYERFGSLEAEDAKRRKQPFAERLQGIVEHASKAMPTKAKAETEREPEPTR